MKNGVSGGLISPISMSCSLSEKKLTRSSKSKLSKKLRNVKISFTPLSDISLNALKKAHFPTTEQQCSANGKKYEVIATIATGSSCKVYKVRDTMNGKYYAMKTMPRVSENEEILVEMEYRCLKELKGCDGVLQLVDFFEDKCTYNFVTEFGDTDLFNYVQSRGGIDELETKKIVRKLIEVVGQLHKRGIVHRDIKPENVMLTNKNEKIKLIDFGDALSDVGDKKKYYGLVGTTFYLSPERWRKRQTGWQLKASDIWAIGVLTYEMVYGQRLFHSSNQDNAALRAAVLRNEWKFPKESLESGDDSRHVSPICKHFIQSLLTFDPSHRPSAQLVLFHPWLAPADTPMEECVSKWNDYTFEDTPCWATYEPCDHTDPSCHMYKS